MKRSWKTVPALSIALLFLACARGADEEYVESMGREHAGGQPDVRECRRG